MRMWVRKRERGKFHGLAWCGGKGNRLGKKTALLSSVCRGEEYRARGEWMCVRENRITKGEMVVEGGVD